MSPLNRREFLCNSITASASLALASHLFAMSAECAHQPSAPESHETSTWPSVQPQLATNVDFVNWREQGLNFGVRAYHNREYLR